MNNTNSHSKEYEDMAGFLAGEMTEAEKELFLKDMKQNPERNNLFQDLKKLWHTLEPNPDDFQVSTQEAWTKLNKRFEEEDNLGSNDNKEIKIRTPLQWAAAILILLCVGSLSYLYYHNTRNNTPMFSIINEDSSTLVHTLEDGSVIYLRPNTRLLYHISNNQRKASVKGEAFFDIAHDPQKPFSIEANNVLIEVLGTSFNVNTNKTSGPEIFVEKGKVQVSLLKNKTNKTSVEKGELLTVVNNKLEKSLQEYNTTWRKNHLHFKDEKLENILSVINHNYNSKLAIYESELKNRRLTVTFNNNAISTITELICLSLNLDHEIRPDSTIVFKQKK